MIQPALLCYTYTCFYLCLHFLFNGMSVCLSVYFLSTPLCTPTFRPEDIIPVSTARPPMAPGRGHNRSLSPLDKRSYRPLDANTDFLTQPYSLQRSLDEFTSPLPSDSNFNNNNLHLGADDQCGVIDEQDITDLRRSHSHQQRTEGGRTTSKQTEHSIPPVDYYSSNHSTVTDLRHQNRDHSNVPFGDQPRKHRSNGSESGQFCSRCGHSLVHSRRNVQCAICSQRICSSCATWQTEHESYMCDQHRDEPGYE